MSKPPDKEKLLNYQPNIPSDVTGTYVFVSYDLVNSTHYKHNSGNTWMCGISDFFGICEQVVKQWLPDHFKKWKYLGDELIFACRIQSIDAMVDLPNQVYYSLRELNLILKGNYNHELSAKSTLWSAFACDIDSDRDECSRRNVILRNRSKWSDAEWLDLDFIGKDIDTGFRIAKHTHKGILTIDAVTAYFCCQNSKKYTNNYKIVEYQSLKGILSERPYPIIWYHHNWDLDQIFDYDEKLFSALYKKLCENFKCFDNNLPPPLEVGRLIKDTTNIDYLNKVLNDLYLNKIVDNIKFGITLNRESRLHGNKSYEIRKERMSELHLVAICINKDKRIMVCKRSSNKAVLPGLWEFGCCRLTPNKNFIQALKDGYKKEFNLNLTIDKNAIPIATYSFKDQSGRIVPGLIFKAAINITDVTQIKHSEEKHSEIRLLSLEECKKLPRTKLVKNFIKHACLALKI